MENFTDLNSLIFPGFKNKGFVKSIALQKNFDNIIWGFFSIENILVSSKLLTQKTSLDKDGISDQKEREGKKRREKLLANLLFSCGSQSLLGVILQKQRLSL